MSSEITSPKYLTYKQKLEAVAWNYYQGGRARWKPKAGDYYTMVRNDLELYQISREDEEYFYTIYCFNDTTGEARWEKALFLEEFGIYRIEVPAYIFKMPE